MPGHVDWTSVIGLANQTLTTPALIDLVDQFAPEMPEDVCTYIRNIHRRNDIRNARLTAQLEEAIVAMNGRGVTPVLLKGAAMLATAPDARRGTRLMSDLDILVTPDQAATALDALAEIAYERYFQTPAHSAKWYTELKRSRDAGMIDLQRSAPGPAYLYQKSGEVLEHCRPISVGRGSAHLPTSTYQALMLIVHDQFQDEGYWTCQIDLRHLVELRDLTNSPEGIDWGRLASFIPGKLARNAIETQLVAAAELLGLDVPATMRSRLIPRLQYTRLLIQARFPTTRWPLLSIAILDYRNYRREAGAGGSRRSAWSIPRADSVQFILSLMARVRIGKV